MTIRTSDTKISFFIQPGEISTVHNLRVDDATFLCQFCSLLLPPLGLINQLRLSKAQSANSKTLTIHGHTSQK